MSARKFILVLDDSPLVLGIVSDALKHAGFDVALAPDLRAFEQHIAKITPDLILIDVNMPEAFGDDVGAVLRGVRKLTAPIWLFSNLDDAALEARSRDAGLDGFISKRAGVDVLIQRVQGILGAHVVS
jgi:DNA-binding response OmpR family regulator